MSWPSTRSTGGCQAPTRRRRGSGRSGCGCCAAGRKQPPEPFPPCTKKLWRSFPNGILRRPVKRWTRRGGSNACAGSGKSGPPAGTGRGTRRPTTGTNAPSGCGCIPADQLPCRQDGPGQSKTTQHTPTRLARRPHAQQPKKNNRSHVATRSRKCPAQTRGRTGDAKADVPGRALRDNQRPFGAATSSRGPGFCGMLEYVSSRMFTPMRVRVRRTRTLYCYVQQFTDQACGVCR